MRLVSSTDWICSLLSKSLKFPKWYIPCCRQYLRIMMAMACWEWHMICTCARRVESWWLCLHSCLSIAWTQVWPGLQSTLLRRRNSSSNIWTYLGLHIEQVRFASLHLLWTPISLNVHEISPEWSLSETVSRCMNCCPKVLLSWSGRMESLHLWVWVAVPLHDSCVTHIVFLIHHHLVVSMHVRLLILLIHLWSLVVIVLSLLPIMNDTVEWVYLGEILEHLVGRVGLRLLSWVASHNIECRVWFNFKF